MMATILQFLLMDKQDQENLIQLKVKKGLKKEYSSIVLQIYSKKKKRI